MNIHFHQYVQHKKKLKYLTSGINCSWFFSLNAVGESRYNDIMIGKTTTKKTWNKIKKTREVTNKKNVAIRKLEITVEPTDGKIEWKYNEKKCNI